MLNQGFASATFLGYLGLRVSCGAGIHNMFSTAIWISLAKEKGESLPPGICRQEKSRCSWISMAHHSKSKLVSVPPSVLPPCAASPVNYPNIMEKCKFFLSKFDCAWTGRTKHNIGEDFSEVFLHVTTLTCLTKHRLSKIFKFRLLAFSSRLKFKRKNKPAFKKQ